MIVAFSEAIAKKPNQQQIAATIPNLRCLKSKVFDTASSLQQKDKIGKGIVVVDDGEMSSKTVFA